MKNNEQDEKLRGNEKIEQAIALLQQQPTQEQLAHTLTILRRRMIEGGQLIIAVEPSGTDNLQLQTIKTDDGAVWWMAFTSFDEEIKGAGQVMSTFLTDIEKLFMAVIQTSEIAGLIINPWNRTIMLDKHLIQIILGNSGKK